MDEARPVVRFDDARPDDGPAVRPVDFADELRAEVERPEVPEAALLVEADLVPAFLAVDLECDLALGLELERLEVLPPREDFDELFAFSG